MEGLRRAVRVPDFRALLLSFAVNRTGDQLGIFALAIVVYDRTGSALTTAALFIATEFGPGLIGPLLVARIDRLQLGRVLPAIYAIETVLFALLAAIAPHGPVAVVVTVAFIDATLAFSARVLTRSGAATTLADRDLIAEGKAAFNVVFAFATTGGPALAAGLVATGGARVALALDSGSFLIAALVLLGARGLRATRQQLEADPGPAWQRVREGFRYVGRHPALRGLIVAEGMAFVFFYFAVPVTVVYAKQSLHAGTGGYGAIMATWGAGIVLGSLIQAPLARRAGPRMILASTGAVAIGYLGTAAAPTLAVACVASVVGGIGNGTQWAAVETVVHRLVAEEFRARVAATLEALMAIAPGFGIIAGGALAASWSPRAAYVVAGAGLCVLMAGSSIRSDSLFAAGSRLPQAPDPLAGIEALAPPAGFPGAPAAEKLLADAMAPADGDGGGYETQPGREPAGSPPKS